MEKNDQPDNDRISDQAEPDTLIELTDIAKPADPDDEPIELTDVAQPTAAEDDELIELTDVVPPTESEDDELIELTDVAQPAEVEEDEPIELTDVAQPAVAEEDEPIELADVAQPAVAEEDELIELTDVAPSAGAEEDEPIELTDAVPQAAAEEDQEIEMAETDLSIEPVDLDQPDALDAGVAAIDQEPPEPLKAGDEPEPDQPEVAEPLEDTAITVPEPETVEPEEATLSSDEAADQPEIEEEISDLADVLGLPSEPGAEEEMKEPADIAEDDFDQAEDAWETPSEEREIHEFVDLAGQAAAELSDADNALAALEEPGDSLDEDEDITTAMGMEINTEPEGSTLLDLYQNWESALEDEDVQGLDEPVTEEQADTKAFTAQSAPPDLTPTTGPDQTPLAASAEQIEAVVEKVLTRLLADKIEARVIETIEKAVTKEIERLREALLEE